MWGSGHNRSLESTSKNVTFEHQTIVVLEAHLGTSLVLKWASRTKL